MRAALYDELTGARRAQLHRRIGGVLDDLTSERPYQRIDELAHHWLAATSLVDPAMAIRYAQRAGDRAMSGFAFEEAAKYYDQALKLCQHGDADSEPVRCDLLTALCDAERRSGSHIWRETAAKAVTVARRVGDPVRLAQAALGHARPSGVFANFVTVDRDL